ncbi:hypothetical protein BGZ82_008266 [Podila clonocystis]|nr:hypothetical protein BGZ82_008266 [Podila clonocystis]
MKTSFIITTLALAACVSAQTASDIDLGNKVVPGASGTECGPNFVSKANTCQSVFTNGKCTSYTVGCGCANAAGDVSNGSTQILESTFEATKGACSDLPTYDVPINTNTTSSTAGAVATSTGSSPSGTPSPEKGNSAGKAATNAFLAVAAAVGAAALAL